MSNFEGTYVGWRSVRIEKILQVFDKNFFKDKSVLELGCGHGHIGKHFTEKFGSIVTLAEGDPAFIENIRNNNRNSEVIVLDQDKPWDLKKKFDVVIHWGVLYHLDNWQQDLDCACKHTDLLFLESEVADSDDPTFEFKFNDHSGFDQALNTKATRPSAAYIESELKKNGFEFVRYDDADLNYFSHTYDWKVTNDPSHCVVERYGFRRFWIARRK
jgi:SAM-dependent methyltransferase